MSTKVIFYAVHNAARTRWNIFLTARCPLNVRRIGRCFGARYLISTSEQDLDEDESLRLGDRYAYS